LNIAQIIYHIVTNKEYAEIVLNSINLNFITSKHEKIILKALQSYANKYNNLPTEGVLNSIIESIVKTSSDDIYYDIQQNIMSFDSKKYYELSLDSILEETEKLIKDLAIDVSVKDLILYKSKQGENIEEEEMYGYIAAISEAYSFTLSKSLGHDYVNDFLDRMDYYSTQYENGIYTSIDSLNKVLGLAGFMKKTLNIFLAPPHTGKCVTYNSKVLLRNSSGEIYETDIGSLYEKLQS
jgi:hypothetical protein